MRVHCLMLLPILCSPVGAHRARDGTGCQKMDRDRASLFISYEMLATTSGPQAQSKTVVLRLRNNTDCVVWLVAIDNKPSGAQIVESGGHRRIEFTDQLRDGIMVDNLKYYVVPQGPQTQRRARKLIAIDEVHIQFAVQPGRSVLFKVPLEEFNNPITIEVPFFYEWDVVDFPKLRYHRVYIANTDLPSYVREMTAPGKKNRGRR